jgi:hypothetical protein
MRINMSIKHFVLLLSIIGFVFAGTDGSIRGKITNLAGEPLPSQVFIEELGLGAVADFEGDYHIVNIPVGTYDVTFMMMGFGKVVIQDVKVMMDQSVYLNQILEEERVAGEVVIVTAEKALVEKGTTSKKITIGKDAIEALPIRDITELYTLQSGVVKVESKTQGIPDHEERGLEEVHVRGGRSGEIAYMIDGLYIRNPIFGGIGNGTRLNLFAVKEFDWQPGGFNAEYGDAMSAVSNMHTNFGNDNFQYKFKYETSMVGAASGNYYDELRGYNDYNFGMGGPIWEAQNLHFWVSGQYTDKQTYSVYNFDNDIFIENDPGNNINRENLVQPWDDVAGLKGFGFDRTFDIFGKVSWKPTNKIRTNISYWNVDAHRKIFNTRFMYWDKGQNELFRDTERFTFELNHQLSGKTFYTARYSRFEQGQFQGVRWADTDEDGYPDWYEWSHGAGEREMSDAYNPNVIPYEIVNGDTIHYTMKDGNGPGNWTSGWYYGAEPGNYNWDVADDFTDVNGNGIYEPSIDIFENGHDLNDNSVYDGPSQTEACYERDGSYWLTPEMYVNWEKFTDFNAIFNQYEQDPWYDEFFADAMENVSNSNPPNNPPTPAAVSVVNNYTLGDSLYYLFGWDELKAFGGHDRFYGTSMAITDEYRFDFTSQLTKKWKLRTGVDWKTHKLNFFEVKNPWDDIAAFRQRFSEQWDDYGFDGVPMIDNAGVADEGEGNGVWDEGEAFSDFNGNGRWDDYVEPEELSVYVQNTFEVPWMVINAGVRLDAVNYNSKIWADTDGEFSPGIPYYFNDENQNGEWDDSEEAGTDPKNSWGSKTKVIFKDSEWLWKLSPRLGFSHVITDQATFTFNYGLYYQTPVYQNVYLNTNRQEDPQELFEEGEGYIGNATMLASRTQSYEFGFNIQVNRNWAYSLMGWVKDMDQLATAKTYRSGVYEYQIYDNGDYGSAKGIDFTLQNRGMLFTTMLQYTYSHAKANSQYDGAAFGSVYVDAPSQEYTMPYDRTHDASVTLFTVLPFGIMTSFTGFYQSGAPYTPMIFNGDKPEQDVKNKYTKRGPAYKNTNMSLSKYISMDKLRLTLGLNIFNVLNSNNAWDVWPLTGKSDDPGDYYTDEVALPAEGGSLSSSFYDMPWFYAPPRQINFFVKIEFK